MIYRAIVEEVIDNYTAKIRIPLIHRTSMSSNHILSRDLPEAKICTLPNTHPNICRGDVVIVALENNDATKPLIIGYLYIDKEYSTAISPTFYSLDVQASCNLSSATAIGEVTSFEIQQLQGTRDNLQRQIDLLSDQVKTLKESLNTISTKLKSLEDYHK